ncbi:hypothetical protein OC835_006888 [Tilletia horrida]|nr:hypothetical protein OC835_006888 [Tilletia horrida]
MPVSPALSAMMKRHPMPFAKREYIETLVGHIDGALQTPSFKAKINDIMDDHLSLYAKETMRFETNNIAAGYQDQQRERLRASIKDEAERCRSATLRAHDLTKTLLERDDKAKQDLEKALQEQAVVLTKAYEKECGKLRHDYKEQDQRTAHLYEDILKAEKAYRERREQDTAKEVANRIARIERDFEDRLRRANEENQRLRDKIEMLWDEARAKEAKALEQLEEANEERVEKIKARVRELQVEKMKADSELAALKHRFSEHLAVDDMALSSFFPAKRTPSSTSVPIAASIEDARSDPAAPTRAALTTRSTNVEPGTSQRRDWSQVLDDGSADVLESSVSSKRTKYA